MDTKKTIRDMTSGSPMRLILGFAVPMLLGILFQQLYSMVDTVMVGRFLGADALAAVGSTGAINFMVNGFVIGATAGFAIPVAQRFGARDFGGMRQYVGNIVWLTILFSAVMTACMSVLAHQVLVWMHTPDEILEQAYSYIVIIFMGLSATYLYNITASIVRSLGDSKSPVYFLMISSVLNIILDYVTIRILGMGVRGQALATIISQLVSGVLCFFYMVRRFDILTLKQDDLRMRAECVQRLLWMAIPMGLQYSITSIGNIILQTAVNTLGVISVAAVTAGDRISVLFACVFDSLGGTMATYQGQNRGALKYDRLKAGAASAMKIGAVYSVIAVAVLATIGWKLPLLFVTNGNAEVVAGAHQYLMTQVLFFIPLCAVNVFRFSIQGMGFSGIAIIAGICEMFGRGLAGFLGVRYFGYTAACLAAPLAWLFADAFLIPCFYRCVRKLGKEETNSMS